MRPNASRNCVAEDADVVLETDKGGTANELLVKDAQVSVVAFSSIEDTNIYTGLCVRVLR